MKISTLVVFLVAVSIMPGASAKAAPFGADNIVLKSFTAIQAGQAVKVSWEFASEETAVNCALEKSTDGITFQAVRTVHISSTILESKHSFTDLNASGQVYYRLRITKTNYIPFVSPVLAVQVNRASVINDTEVASVILNPNTMFGDLMYRDEVMQVILVDIAGRTRFRQNIRGADLDRQFKPSYGNLPEGFYILSVSSMNNETLLKRALQKF